MKEVKTKKERINITIDPWLLTTLDMCAINYGYNRSQFIARCIAYFIKQHNQFKDGDET